MSLATAPCAERHSRSWVEGSSQVIDMLASWSRASAEIIGRINDPKLPDIVDATLFDMVPFDLSCAFAYPEGRGAVLLFDGFRSHRPGESMAAYLNGTYLLDPFYFACANRTVPGLYRMRQISPDAFVESEYFNSWEVHPCISMESGSLAEEIAFLIPLPGGTTAAYSLMRGNGSPAFSDAEMVLLRAVEPVIHQALRHHWRHIPATPGRGRRSDALSEDAALEAEFVAFGGDLLTLQQKRIVSLILRGHSNASIGLHLSIAEGTVKNHRRSIYERLAISTQGELFALFVRQLSR